MARQKEEKVNGRILEEEEFFNCNNNSKRRNYVVGGGKMKKKRGLLDVKGRRGSTTHCSFLSRRSSQVRWEDKDSIHVNTSNVNSAPYTENKHIEQ